MFENKITYIFQQIDRKILSIKQISFGFLQIKLKITDILSFKILVFQINHITRVTSASKKEQTFSSVPLSLFSAISHFS